MGIEELESEALKLEPGSRARLAERLLASLDDLSDQENLALWAAEASRRDAEMSSDPASRRPAGEVIDQARSRVR